MTGVLVRKLLRDIRVPLAGIMLLLFAFQILWSVVSKRITADIITSLGQFLSISQLRDTVFRGPGQIVNSLIGGSMIRIEYAQDMLSVAYVHPLTQAILCIWAVGRASAAIAGEIDRGTMELLMAQPIPRSRLIRAHLCVDLITIPLLCASIWGGTWLGAWLSGLLDVNARPELQVNPWRFAPALAAIALLAYAVSGYSMLLSSLGRARGRVLGVAIFITLVQFLLNLVGQLWQPLAWARPFTVFFYYRPQQIILQPDWHDWMWLGVLLAVGVMGYALATWWFCRRDLPAPL